MIPSLLCITLHELSHGQVAYKLGDDTAKSRGRLSLNPLKHLDPVGLLMMLVFHVGWAKPVPVNMYKFKNPKPGMAVTALAGPLEQFDNCRCLHAGSRSGPLNMSSVGHTFLQMIQLTAVLSIGLGIFNILPIPPLDYFLKVLFSLLRDEDYNISLCAMNVNHGGNNNDYPGG
ncbi:MAG: site-2 protease family protein [Oscillospiraceae bacterium]